MLPYFLYWRLLAIIFSYLDGETPSTGFEPGPLVWQSRTLPLELMSCVTLSYLILTIWILEHRVLRYWMAIKCTAQDSNLVHFSVRRALYHLYHQAVCLPSKVMLTWSSNDLKIRKWAWTEFEPGALVWQSRTLPLELMSCHTFLPFSYHLNSRTWGALILNCLLYTSPSPRD